MLPKIIQILGFLLDFINPLNNKGFSQKTGTYLTIVSGLIGLVIAILSLFTPGVYTQIASVSVPQPAGDTLEEKMEPDNRIQDVAVQSVILTGEVNP